MNIQTQPLSTLGKYIVIIFAVVLTSACASTSNPKSTDSSDIQSYSDDVFKISQQAERAYNESRWGDAAMHYQLLSEKVPSDAYIWFKLANTYVQKGEFDQAIFAYQKSIERDALQPKPWFNLSTTYLLNAKTALLHSWNNLRPDDPARDMIARRVSEIDRLLNEEMGEVKVRRR